VAINSSIIRVPFDLIIRNCSPLLISSILSISTLILLNLPFLVLAQSNYIIRPIFNIDLILVVAICLLNIRIGILLLIIIWGLDAYLVASLNFHFGVNFDFLQSIVFINALNLYHFINAEYASILFLFAFCGVLAIYTLRNSKFSLKSLVIFGFLIICLDLLNGSMSVFGLGEDRLLVYKNIAGSPVYNLAISKWQLKQIAPSGISKFSQPKTFQIAGDWNKRHPNNSILVIIVESMGRPLSPKLQLWLEQQIFVDNITSRWETTASYEHFYGSTTGAELRVLCSLFGSYSSINVTNASNCLPNRLNAAGYNTTGLHGFTSQMFNRQYWWPIIGLHSQIFAEQKLASNSICGGAFPGICDADMISKAVSIADKPKQFVYLLTLNTHLPLEKKILPNNFLNLCHTESVDISSCEMVFSLGELLKSVSIALQGAKHPFFVEIVGDHSPPFLNRVSRLSFDQKMVPLYILKPLK
jgi:hypothetical protein